MEEGVSRNAIYSKIDQKILKCQAFNKKSPRIFPEKSARREKYLRQ
jgi:hypothetical protein